MCKLKCETFVWIDGSNWSCMRKKVEILKKCKNLEFKIDKTQWCPIQFKRQEGAGEALLRTGNNWNGFAVKTADQLDHPNHTRRECWHIRCVEWRLYKLLMKILLLHIARLHRVEGNLVRHMRTTPMPKVQCRRCSKYIIHRPDFDGSKFMNSHTRRKKLQQQQPVELQKFSTRYTNKQQMHQKNRHCREKCSQIWSQNS